MGLMYRLFMTFFKIGAFTIGGGYAMVPLIQTEVVDKNGWLTSEEFIDILAIAEATPGPVAINTSTYVGYKLLGFKGALVGTLGTVLPSFGIILIIVNYLWEYRNNSIVEKVFMGIRPAVAALIFSAVYKIYKQLNPDRPKLLGSILTIIVILILDVSPIYIILSTVIGSIIFFKNKEKDI